MRRLILRDTEKKQKKPHKLLESPRKDFYQMFQTVQDKPMIVRLLDPPMHRVFLPMTPKKFALLASKLKKFS